MQHEQIMWHAKMNLEKYSDDALIAAGIDPARPTHAQLESAKATGVLRAWEEREEEGNLLTFGGASALWDLLKAAGNVTAFSNANAHIGVGDSNTAAANTQTDLIASTNKFRQPMEATFPTHTDGTTSGAHQIVFKSIFATGDANYAWEEWAVFNASTAGRMLNRKVESLGTKVSGAWTLTITLSLA